MTFEIRQGGIPCLWRWCAATLEKQSHMSHETAGCERGEAGVTGSLSVPRVGGPLRNRGQQSSSCFLSAQRFPTGNGPCQPHRRCSCLLLCGWQDSRQQARPEPLALSSQGVPARTSEQLPDLVATRLGEPEVAIGPRRDAKRRAVGRRGGKLGDAATGGDAPDLVASGLGEPEVAIGPRRDARRRATRRRNSKLADFAGERQGAGSGKGQHADEQAE
jgi:hypothetical protein